MTSPIHTVVVHLALEPTSAQLQELEELGRHVQALRVALWQEAIHAAAGLPVTVENLLKGKPTPPVDPSGVPAAVPSTSRTTHVRQLLQLRQSLGWTQRVSSDVVEQIVQEFHGSGSSGVPTSRPRLSCAEPGTEPLVIPLRTATVISLETVEVAGLSDGHVLVHLGLPQPLERALTVHLNDTRYQWRVQAEERSIGAARGSEKDAQALAHLHARYGHHLVPDLPLPLQPPGMQAKFGGVTALVRQPALDGGLRWFVRLNFDVWDVPSVMSDDLIGIDVGIHHPVCGSAGDGAVLVENPLPLWSWPEVTRKQDRVTTPFSAARSRVRWYARLHGALQPALTARLLGPTGVLTYRHIALEQLDFRQFQGPAGFGAFMMFSGLAAYLEIVQQLRDVVYVDPRHTSLLDSCTGQPGVRRGLLFHPPGRPARLADLNAAANIRRRGQALLHREVRT